MGNPLVKLKRTYVEVNGFDFNVGMTIFCEELEKQKSSLLFAPGLEQMATHIQEHGYDNVMDTAFYLDGFISSEKARSDLLAYLRQLIKLVMSSGYQLPEAWQKLLRGEIGGSQPIPITREHYLGVAYIYQLMIDLIEGRIEGEYVQCVRPPNGWGGMTA